MPQQVSTLYRFAIHINISTSLVLASFHQGLAFTVASSQFFARSLIFHATDELAGVEEAVLQVSLRST